MLKKCQFFRLERVNLVLQDTGWMNVGCCGKDDILVSDREVLVRGRPRKVVECHQSSGLERVKLELKGTIRGCNNVCVGLV